MAKIADLAPFATDPAHSRGRLHPDTPSPLRSRFARDRDRLIHSTAFRRLRYKTQVFVAPEQDHFRVRLTHSLEVAQIARSIARILALDEDLAEVVALAHDLGHPPFGHAGEDALAAAMAAHGGFEHNGHAIRILTRLEHRTPDYDGLNLCWEVLEGIAKHNGPVGNPGWALREQEEIWPLELHTHAGPEAQVAALADDIAYNAHDLDDGLRAGLFDIVEVAANVPIVDRLWRDVQQRWPAERDTARLIPPLVRDLIGAMVDGLLQETRARLRQLQPQTVADVRAADRAVVAFPPAIQAELEPLRAWLMAHMYRHPSVALLCAPATTIVGELFAELYAQPQEMPAPWRQRLAREGLDATRRAHIVADYVAGMTDRFAIHEHARLTGRQPMPADSLF